MKWDAFGRRKKDDPGVWKKGPRRKAVQKDKLRGREGEGYQPKQCKKQDHG